MASPQKRYSDKFQSAASNTKKRPSPLSIRLTPDERSRLEQAAKGMSLNAYVKGCLFREDAPSPALRVSTPVKDKTALAQALGKMGQSQLSKSMEKLSHAAFLGTLYVDASVEKQIHAACQNIEDIKSLLMKALRIKES